MVFTSCTFIFLFFPITMIIYFLLGQQFKNYFLFIASLAFYAWGKPSYIILLFCSVTANYIIARLLDITDRILIRKAELFLALIFNIGMLGVFKYLNFIISNINMVFGQVIIQPTNIALPIGISFYTFQGLSYVIDVYRKNVKAQKNIVYFGLYIAMFPQLVAGPIVRYIDIEKDISERKVTLVDIGDGVRRFVLGFSKKILIADMLGSVADQIFLLQSSEINITTAWVGALAYTMQIFFDFSGYSDMAIGMGRMLGFRFNENFNYPYISKSISEFWRRWHISLSSWFRDYLYIPMGGNRKGNVYINLFIVFLVTGVWHGASWTFVVWGIWHGSFVLLERFLKNKIQIKQNNFINILRWLYSMFVIVVGWVLFKSDNLLHAIKYLMAMVGIGAKEFIPFKTTYYLNYRVAIILIIASIGSTPMLSKLLGGVKIKNNNLFLDVFECVGLLILFVLSLICLVNTSYNAFIYFQF